MKMFSLFTHSRVKNLSLCHFFIKNQDILKCILPFHVIYNNNFLLGCTVPLNQLNWLKTLNYLLYFNLINLSPNNTKHDILIILFIYSVINCVYSKNQALNSLHFNQDFIYKWLQVWLLFCKVWWMYRSWRCWIWLKHIIDIEQLE